MSLTKQKWARRPKNQKEKRREALCLGGALLVLVLFGLQQLFPVIPDKLLTASIGILSLLYGFYAFKDRWTSLAAGPGANVGIFKGDSVRVLGAISMIAGIILLTSLVL